MDIRAKLFCICPKCFKNLPKYFENGCFLDITGRKKYICPKYCIIEEIIYFYKAMGTDVTDNPIIAIAEDEPYDLQMVCRIG